MWRDESDLIIVESVVLSFRIPFLFSNIITQSDKLEQLAECLVFHYTHVANHITWIALCNGQPDAQKKYFSLLLFLIYTHISGIGISPDLRPTSAGKVSNRHAALTQERVRILRGVISTRKTMTFLVDEGERAAASQHFIPREARLGHRQQRSPVASRDSVWVSATF